MIDHLFTLTLAFAVLAGATLAMSSDFLSTQPAEKPVPKVAVLPRVVVNGEVQAAQTELAKAVESAENRSGANARVQ